MTFHLSPLPYALDALAPHMSARTLGLHHGAHHRGYVKTLNTLIENTDMAKMSLEDIIFATANDISKAAVFNNAAQDWNHRCFWASMKPNGGGKPSGDLARRIDESFGGYDQFYAEFVEAAGKRFGSGWVWLIVNDEKLAVVTTANAINPVVQRKTALIGCDIWEHAYYLDFENRRPDFVKSFLDHLVNWDFAAENLTKIGSYPPL